MGIDDLEMQSKNYIKFGDKCTYDGNINKAFECYEKALSLNAYNVSALYSLGVLYYKNSEFGNAIIHLEKALSINPDLFEAYTILGMAYYQLEEYEISIEKLNKACSSKPNDAIPFAALGKVYLELGNKDLSAEYLAKAKKLDSNLSESIDSKLLKIH